MGPFRVYGALQECRSISKFNEKFSATQAVQNVNDGGGEAEKEFGQI